MPDSMTITALLPESLAKLLSAAYRRNITVDMVNEVVSEGGLLSDTGTVNMLEFTAYLLKGDKNDS